MSPLRKLALICILALAEFARADESLDSTLRIGGGTIDLTSPAPLPIKSELVKQWTERAAVALTHFYGRFPVKYVKLVVSPASHGRIGGGVEHNGERIDIHLGPQTRASDLLADWTLTHEMFHLSQPDLEEDYSWMSEGMADYLEPVARVSVNQITPEKFWGDLVDGLPQGLPETGDQGLDRTHTWARTYWGGALFWFLADVRIRQQTHNQKSVRDAAKAALDAGGDGSQEWPLDRLIEVYDRGTVTTVFKDLHDEMGNKPVQTDLDGLWKSLGVLEERGRVTFDDKAPLAEIRRGITSR